MKICVDPGHSGKLEPGACAKGLLEADINLQLGKILDKLLKKQGHEVIMTRRDEIEDDGLTWRAELANRNQADLFVSLHCNSAPNSSARGTETWYFEGSEKGAALAHAIQEQIVRRVETANRGIKASRGFTVLQKTDCPAVLVEMAFLSNADDRILLTDLLLRRLFPIAIVEGIEAWRQQQDLNKKSAEH